MVGFLEISFGPMMSGKTKNLMKSIHDYYDSRRSIGKKAKCIIISSKLDNRENSSRGISTHCSSGVYIPTDIETVAVDNLSEVNVKDYDYIAIDESQFFKDLKEVVIEWLKLNKTIHCAGLIADVKLQPFGKLSELFAYASKINHFKAICVKCLEEKECHGNNAAFTNWKDSTEPKDQICVGDKEYISVCNVHCKF